MSMFIGESLVGDGNEVAHIDLMIGEKTGPVGMAFANALARQSEGHSNLLAVLAPNLLCKPATVLITKVTIKGAEQAVQMFGPAQAAVAKAVTDSVAEGVIPKAQAENSSSSAASSSTGTPRTTPKSTSTTTKRPRWPSGAMKSEPKIDEILGARRTRPSIRSRRSNSDPVGAGYGREATASA